jgi:hypothetical protein
MTLRLDGDRVPATAIRTLQQQAAHLLSLGKKQMVAPYIDESLSLTELRACDADETAGPPPFQGRWLHLLAAGERRPVYVLSRPIGPTQRDWLVLAVVSSDLGNRIRRAVIWARRHVRGEYAIGLLRVPETRLAALLLKPRRKRDESLVVIVHAPTQPALTARLRSRSYADFVTALKGVAPVDGVAQPRSGRVFVKKSPQRG